MCLEETRYITNLFVFLNRPVIIIIYMYNFRIGTLNDFFSFQTFVTKTKIVNLLEFPLKLTNLILFCHPDDLRFQVYSCRTL